tara:strand:- start:558 stop:746 length:189 start_codon:yes stop_codon:yes gene_type:complete
MDDILSLLPEDCDSCPIKKFTGGCSHDAMADGCKYQDFLEDLASKLPHDGQPCFGPDCHLCE